MASALKVETENPVTVTESSEEAVDPAVMGGNDDDGLALLKTIQTMARRFGELEEANRKQSVAQTKLEEKARKREILQGHSQYSPGYHQLTAFAITAAEESEDKQLAGLGPKVFAGGVALLLSQSITVVAVSAAAMARSSCVSNDQCGQGFFCRTGKEDALEIAEHQICEYCSVNPMGYAANLPQFTNMGGYNYTTVAALCATPAQPRPWDAYNPTGTVVVKWPAKAVQNWCDVCVFFDGDGVLDIDGYNAIAQIYSNVALMGKTDWLAFGLTGTVVGLTAAREVRDILVCDLLIANVKNQAWRVVLTIQSGVRRYFFLPCLVACIPALVVYQGGDALTVCLNAVALLFLADIDNYAYGFAITDALRVHLETESRGKMGELDANVAVNSQVVHVVMVVLSLCAGVTIRSRMSSEEAAASEEAYSVWFAHAILGMSMPWWGCMFARIVEVMSGGADISANSKMKSIASALGVSISGFLVYIIMMLVMIQ